MWQYWKDNCWYCHKIRTQWNFLYPPVTGIKWLNDLTYSNNQTVWSDQKVQTLYCVMQPLKPGIENTYAISQYNEIQNLRPYKLSYRDNEPSPEEDIQVNCSAWRINAALTVGYVCPVIKMYDNVNSLVFLHRLVQIYMSSKKHTSINKIIKEPPTIYCF